MKHRTVFIGRTDPYLRQADESARTGSRSLLATWAASSLSCLVCHLHWEYIYIYVHLQCRSFFLLYYSCEKAKQCPLRITTFYRASFSWLFCLCKMVSKFNIAEVKGTKLNLLEIYTFRQCCEKNELLIVRTTIILFSPRALKNVSILTL